MNVKFGQLVGDNKLTVFIFSDETPQLLTEAGTTYLKDLYELIALTFGRDIYIYKISMFANTNLCERFNISYNPTIVIMRGLKELYQYQGIIDKDRFVNTILPIYISKTKDNER